MAVLLQIDFPFSGPFGAEMSKALADLAKSINDEPGFIWKIWTENHAEQTAGGIYIFQTEAMAKAYLAKHSERLTAFGVKNIRGKLFAVNEALSKINHAPDSCLS